MLSGARHASFAGEAAAGLYWNDPTFQQRTSHVSLLFLDAVLREDAAAGRMLGAGAGLKAPDMFEAKLMGAVGPG